MIKPGKSDIVYDAPDDFDVEKTVEEAVKAGLDVRFEGNQLVIEKKDRFSTNFPVTNPRQESIARALLNSPIIKNAKAAMEAGPDDRPLIDKLQEATFTDTIGLQWIEDKYALRMMLRKANCFTLDDATSALVADFSLAISTDLESSRQIAIPPFPLTWIDLNNVERLQRMKALGVGLTPSAAGEQDGPPVPRVGWLISPGEIPDSYYATYVCESKYGVMLAPMSYWWHTGPANSLGERLRGKMGDEGVALLDRLTFGLTNSGVNASDAFPGSMSIHVESLRNAKGYPGQVKDLMIEIGGELRHIWGFLIALGAGQLGVESRYTEQAKPQTERKMPNGKPLLPLVHKVLHLHLAKRTTSAKVVARAITHHHNKEHKVRAHFRLLKSGRRVPVKSHKRGDIRLGRVEKSYSVER